MDADEILAGAARDVKHLRVQEGVLGVVLALCAWPLLGQVGASLVRHTSVGLLPLAVGTALLVSGIVNVWLAFSLRRGAARVARSHWWLSVLGLAAGGVGQSLMVGGVLSSRSRDLPGNLITSVILGMLLLAILSVPARALLMLGRSDVKAYLGISATLDPRTVQREVSAERSDSRKVGTMGSVLLGAAFGILVTLVLVVLLIISAINSLCSGLDHWPRC